MKKTKHIVLCLVLAMILASAPASVSAAVSAAHDANKDRVISQLEQTEQTQEPFAYRTKKMQTTAVENGKDYPASYDLRDVVDANGEHHNYITPVKLQNPFGSCWGFAAIAAAETSILGSGLAAVDGYDATGENGKTELDLSEKHLVNFVSKAIDDPNNPQNGEGMYSMKEGATSADRFNNGGNPFYATSLFSSGIGPNLENRGEIYEYHGANKEIESRQDPEGNWVQFSYSDEDDWDMPEEYRFKQSYVLKESYILPPPANYDNKAETYTYDPAGTAAIKEQILNNRAVEITFCADASQPNQESEQKRINTETWAHYTFEKMVSNHAVVVIGWDDDYPRENFTEGKQPPADMFPTGKEEGRTDGGNGAWLVKNSWGSGENEFPNKGLGQWGITNDKGVHTGYFWLSYYDMSLDMAEALAFDKSNIDNQYYLDQHDYMPVSSIVSMDAEKESKMANVFKADANEQLEQISCQTAAPGTVIKYQVYLLQKAFQDPEDGILMEEGSASFEYGGFHKLDLKDPVIIQKGQSYSIAITQKLPNGKYNINVPISKNKNMAMLFGLNSYQVGVINENESYLSLDGSWVDYSDEEVQNSFVGDTTIDLFALDNFPIKGYCSMIEDPISLIPSVDQLSMERNSEKTITLTLRGSGTAEIGRPKITWEYAGGDEVFTVEYDEGTGSACTVKAGDVPGIGYLKVTAEGFGSRIIPVDVDSAAKYSVEDIYLAEGETRQIEIKNYKGDPVTGKFWYYSDTGKVATVSDDGAVTAVAEGVETITIKDENRVKTTAKVYVEPAAHDGEEFEADQNTYAVISAAKGTAKLIKAKNAGKVTIPKTVIYKGKKLSVTGIGPKAFKGTEARTLIVKTKKLTKKSVRNSLKGSNIKTIKVKVGKKSANKKYVKKYKKIFTKKNAGKKVTVS